VLNPCGFEEERDRSRLEPAAVGVRKLAGRSPFDRVEGWYEGVAAKKATDVLLGFLTETSISANAPA